MNAGCSQRRDLQQDFRELSVRRASVNFSFVRRQRCHQMDNATEFSANTRNAKEPIVRGAVNVLKGRKTESC